MEAKLIKQKGIGFQTLDGSDYFLTIDGKVYHTNPLTSGLLDGGKLSYKNCQAIERGYDLDKLAEDMLKSHKDFEAEGFSDYQNGRLNGIYEGFQKALELLGDKKFSEEDVRSAYFHGEKDSYVKGGQTKEMENEFIQSLEQTEWSVQIEMEYIGQCSGNNDNGCFQDSPGHDCGCFQRNPKLDENGCLILKLNPKSEKSNSCSCNDGIITCPGCDGEKQSEFGVCAGCSGSGIRTCGKCGGKNK